MIAREETEQTSKPTRALVQELRASLKNSTVLTPESEGYTQSIKRWSDAVEKKAVRERQTSSTENSGS